MTRDELILRTRQLIAEGERLDAAPSLVALQTWLQLSDDLLATAWGTMDRYHLAWLMVGKPKGIVRGRGMSADEEAAYVREVASQKTAALRMSLDAVERQGMPFRGETGGIGPGQGMGAVPGAVPGTPVTSRAGTPAEEGGEADRAGAIEGGQATDDGETADDGEAADDGDPANPGDTGPRLVAHRHLAQGSRRSIPLDPGLAERLEAARRGANEHDGHGERRAPRPERLQR